MPPPQVLEHEQLVKAVQDKHIDSFRAGDVLEVKVVRHTTARQPLPHQPPLLLRAATCPSAAHPTHSAPPQPHAGIALAPSLACSLTPAAGRLQVVPEAERRVYTYRGVCVARSNKSLRTWFKIYNVFPDTGGFVQHFPL